MNQVTAIDIAMNITDNLKFSKFIIYPGSKSVLLTPENKDTSAPIMAKFLNKMNTISKNIIILTCVYKATLVYLKMKGQTKLKKKSLLTDIFNTKIPYTVLKLAINKFIITNGKNHWMIKYTTNSTKYKIPSVNGWQVTKEREKKK